MEALFLGYDLGSSAAKAVLKRADGKTVASAVFRHETRAPAPGYAEQNPESQWWKGFKTLVSELIKTRGVDPLSIKAVACTGFIPALCSVDKDGKTLGNGIMHTDLRSMGELKEINSTLSSPISMGTLLPQLLWLKKNERDRYENTWKILNPHSYIAYKLSGKSSCDYDSAFVCGGPELLCHDKNYSILNWESSVFKKLGLDSKKLPEPARADSVLGCITPEAARECGLSEKTLVLCGTGDSFAAMLGFGLCDAGEMMVYLGSSATQILLQSPIEELIGGPHFSPGRAAFTGRILSCGDSLNHFQNLFETKNIQELDKGAEEISAGGDCILWMPHQKQKQENSSILNRESLIGMTEIHTKYHAFRALLEGIAFNIFNNYSTVSSEVKKLTVGGGAAASDIFVQIISDTLNIPVTRSASSGSAEGAALLAAYGSGSVEDLSKSCRQWSESAPVVEPDRESAAYYARASIKRQQIRELLEQAHNLLDSI